MRFALFCFIFIFVTGCAAPTSQIKPELVVKNSDNLNEVLTANFGDVIVQKGEYQRYKAIFLEEDIEAGGGWQMKLFIPSQILIAELEDKKWEYYFGNNITVYDSVMGTRYVNGGIKILKDKNKFKQTDPVQIIGINLQGSFIKKEEPKISRTYATKNSDSGYGMRLMFAGVRAGNVILKFIESMGGEGKEQFDFEYDLNDGNIFELKGAKIRILSVSSTKLEYELLSSFQ